MTSEGAGVMAPPLEVGFIAPFEVEGISPLEVVLGVEVDNGVEGRVVVEVGGVDGGG